MSVKGVFTPVSLNHTIIFADDRRESASFFTELFGLPQAEEWGPFSIVHLDNDGLIQFAEPGIEIQPQHYAFLISEEDFDGIYARMLESNVEHGPSPRDTTSSGTVGTEHGGRRVYFRDPSGHGLKILAVPYNAEI